MSDPPGRRIVSALRENDLEGAARLCEELLARDADDPVALHLKGVVCLRRGDPAGAVGAIGRALALRPGMPDANANLGQALVALDRLDEAQAAFERAATLAPGLGPVERGMAGIRDDLAQKADAVRLHQSGEQARAATAYRELLARRPRYPEVLNNLGVLELQRGDPVLAARLLGKAVESQPAMADAWANLGAALKRSGRIEAAVNAYRHAIGVAPRLASAHYNLGHALVESQRLDEAVAAYATALECEPGHAGARLALIHQRRHLCDWRNFAEDERGLRELIEQDCSDITPFHALVSFDDPVLQARCARRHASSSKQGAEPLAPREAGSRGRIRIGYLSSDFRRHPVAWLIPEVIERHDRARFEVTAYSHGVDDGSAERARLAAGFDRFVDIRADNLDAAARRIRADQIDILIDLNGHTLGARSGILARRPAPLQIAWLGYPGSMGADYIDYTIADAFVVPEDGQHAYTEQLLRLPRCFQPGDTRRAPAARPPSRAGCGLPEKAFVFCSFNNAWKLAPPVFEVWMRLLKGVPGSVLWLLETGATARANLVREAAQRGVDPARLVFAPRAPLAEYLARYAVADLFLDTLPYNAGTTANDALWAGLPLLTCAGRSFAARMAGSVLQAGGLPELVTRSLPEYEALALDLARSPARLADLRRRAGRVREFSPLFDCAGFTRDLESALERIHREAAGMRAR